MDEFSFEEALGRPQAAPPTTRDTSFVIPPEVQAQRDGEAGQIMMRETGGPEGALKLIAQIDRQLVGANPDVRSMLLRQKALYQKGIEGYKAPPANEFSFEDALGPQTPRSEASIRLGAVRAGAAAVGQELGALGDMFVGDLPGALMGLGANAVSRVQSIFAGDTRAEAGRIAKTVQEGVTEEFSPHIFTKIASLLAPKDAEPLPGHLENSLQFVMGLTDKGAAAVEKATGGAILATDLQLARDTLLTGGGVLALKGGARMAADKLASRPAPKSFDFSEPQTVVDEPFVGPNLPWEKSVKSAVPPEEIAAREAAMPADMTPRTRPPGRSFMDEQPTILDLQREPSSQAFAEPDANLSPADVVKANPPSALDTGLAKVSQGRGFDMMAEEVAAIRSSKSVWQRPEIAKGEVHPELLAAIALGTTGASLALRYPDETKAAFASVLGGMVLKGGHEPLTMERLVGMPEGRALGSILAESPYTFKTLENLPQNRVEFTPQMIREQLKREGVTQAERDVFTKALDEHVAGPRPDAITAKELMIRLKLATQDWELKPVETDAFSDYGLEFIERYTEQSRDMGVWADATPEERATAAAQEVPATTTVWQLPQHIRPGEANHFRDPNYFGHTRSFEQGGVRHVVEIQSDLAQKAGKVLSEEERKALTGHLLNVSAQAKVLKPINYTTFGADRTFGDMFEALDPALKELERYNPDVKMKLGRSLQNQGFFRTDKIPHGEGSRVEITLDPELAYDQFRSWTNSGEWASENGGVGHRAVNALEGAWQAYQSNIRLLVEEHTTKLADASKTALVQPLLKNWPKRLVREELARAANERAQTQRLAKELVDSGTDVERGQALADRQPVVRFATADTVAKVEGWPEPRAALEERLRADQAAGADQAYQNSTQALLDKQSTRFRPEHQGIYDRYRTEVEKFLRQLGAKPYTDAHGHTWLEAPVDPSPKGKRTQMLGQADPKLLGGLAAIGLSATIASAFAQDKKLGALVGGVLGAIGVLLHAKSPAIREGAADLAHKADVGLGLVSTRLQNISPVLHRRMLDFEWRILAAGHERLTRAEPFIDALRDLPKASRDALQRALSTRSPAVVQSILDQIGAEGLGAKLATVQGMLREVGQKLHAAGRLDSLLENYFPQMVRDVPGLLAAMGKSERTRLEQMLREAERASIRASGHGLSELEVTNIINKYVRTPERQGSAPGFLQKRTMDSIPPELQKFYYPPDEALVTYLRGASREIEKADFFGRHLTKMRVGDREVIDTDASIGKLIKDEKAAGKIDAKDIDEVKSLLNSRFGPGERTSHWALQGFKDVTSAGLLGNPVSALSQIPDVVVAAGLHGVGPTIEAIARTLSKHRFVSLKDMGLIDHVSEEFSTASRARKALNAIYKYSLFKGIDVFTKDVTMNAAFKKNVNLAKTTRGQAQLAAKYAPAYGVDTGQLIKDFRAGKATDLTKSVVFAELSRTQPVSRLETPQAYLNNPNGRVMYQLKLYPLKQADLLRREAGRDIAQGNLRKGMTSLLHISAALALSGASSTWITNFLLGRGFQPGWEDVSSGLFKNFGWSSFVGDKLKQGDVTGAVADVVSPPLGLMNDVAHAVQGKDAKLAAKIPLAGRLIYEHQLGGQDQWKARQVLQRRRDAGTLPSDEEQARRAERRRRKIERLAQEY